MTYPSEPYHALHPWHEHQSLPVLQEWFWSVLTACHERGLQCLKAETSQNHVLKPDLLWPLPFHFRCLYIVFKTNLFGKFFMIFFQSMWPSANCLMHFLSPVYLADTDDNLQQKTQWL